MKRITLSEFRKLVSVRKLREWITEDGGVELVADGRVIAVVLDSVHIVEGKSKATASVHKPSTLPFSKSRQAAGGMVRR